MRGTHAFQQSRLKRGGFIKLLMFEDSESLAHDLSFIRIATGVDEPLDKLSEGGWQGDCHKVSLRI